MKTQEWKCNGIVTEVFNMKMWKTPKCDMELLQIRYNGKTPG